MAMFDLKSLLSENSYPVRGIVIGKSADGKSALIAYFIMGRSENSRNRIFERFDGGMRTKAFDESKLSDPSLIIYNPFLQLENTEIITNGEIGNVRRVNWIITNWYRPQAYYNSSSWRATWAGEGGGVLMNQCPHQLDLIQWVVGMMPSKIRSFMSFGKYHKIEVEDEVTSYLEYENGATGVFITTTAECGGTNRFEVVGDKGKLVCENDKLILTKLAMSEPEFSATNTIMFAHPESTVSEVETDGINPQHIGIINNFTNAVLGKEELFVDGKEGINGVQIMDAMLLSGFLGGKEVSLPIDDDLFLSELNKKIEEAKKEA